MEAVTVGAYRGDGGEGGRLRAQRHRDIHEAAYATDWRDFEGWCIKRALLTLPAAPAMVGLYLTDRAQHRKVATLQRCLAAISRAHRVAGHRLDTRHPAIADVFAGIRREKGTAPEKKAAIMPADLRSMLEALPETVAGVRDRAVLLLGFAGALRRSELVALDLHRP